VQVSNTLQTLVTLAAAGIIGSSGRIGRSRTALACIRWGATPAAGYSSAAAAIRTRSASSTSSGTLHVPGDPASGRNALAHALAGGRRQRRRQTSRSWPQPPRLRRGVVACSKLGRNALFLNTAFSGPQLPTCRAQKPKAMIYDEEFAEVLATPGTRRKRYIAWHEALDADPALEELIERRRRSDSSPPRAGQGDHPHLGTTGTPKGATARSRSRSTRRRAADAHPAEGARDDDDRAPLFHSWGFAHFTLGMSLVLDDRAQAQVRPESDARR
jgi:fatty-acyl-CoA synthase